MVKKSDSVSLSSDLDFIKEFEELKIRQKLLVDSLKKKNLSMQNDLFNDINSKLDFLIKIFQEANDTSQNVEDENQQLYSKFDDLSEKITSVESNFNERFEDVTELLEKISAKVSTYHLPVQKTNGEKMVDMAPKPDFKVEDNKIGDKVEEKIANSDDKKKKKRWF